MKAPELLAPAGTLKNLRYAVAYGADAVYAGMPRYSLRVRNNDFNHYENLAQGVREAHDKGSQFFLACNVLPHNAKVKTFLADIESAIELNPDALIMADPGLIMQVRERWPDIAVHLSVQANTVNYASVKFWQSLGLKRVILSRELSLDEIAEIRQECPDMELEVFVHGALCIAYSGRCLLSGYFNHRDANQGSCTNSCRWEYDIKKAETDVTGDVVAKNLQPSSSDVYLIEEQERPGELMPIEEDEHGTYIMNSKDLRAVEHVEKLVKLGVDSLKIEGRTKSHYYVARSTQIYRKAIDDAVAGRSFDPSLLGELENLANRGYTDGFFMRHHSHEYQNYMDNHSRSYQQRFVGEIVGFQNGMAEIEAKNKFAVGDEMELILPTQNKKFILEHVEDMKGNAMQEVPGGGHRICIPLDAGEYEMGLLARNEK
ncbi:MAG: tRNA 5-hydroxyuridine modification protein YegQ [Gammaproteobacteria bacterium]|nr:tRNA 5-hydroxyuridine modification protein YegQ [Gammaproteobacteria bacterium]MDH5592864.1 tRNA 5-hydroxyuridine modification protein YegQ [Gammaproteobacteria bacterium]MDH5613652.1 tRNA 5-hydroxyuridine modification protein YegQ [Gammaproteobacteria bacterium]